MIAITVRLECAHPLRHLTAACTEVLSQGEAEKVLDEILSRCEARALERAKKLIEDEERKKERQRLEGQARQRLDQFLNGRNRKS